VVALAAEGVLDHCGGEVCFGVVVDGDGVQFPDVHVHVEAVCGGGALAEP
jgi:hypothetical protein